MSQDLKFTQDKSTAVPVTACEDNTGLLLDKNDVGIMICAVWTSARVLCELNCKSYALIKPHSFQLLSLPQASDRRIFVCL